MFTRRRVVAAATAVAALAIAAPTAANAATPTVRPAMVHYDHHSYGDPYFYGYRDYRSPYFGDRGYPYYNPYFNGYGYGSAYDFPFHGGYGD